MTRQEILKIYFKMPVTERFYIGKQLGVIEKGESIESTDRDLISSKFLNRARKAGKMNELRELLSKSK